jgi:hypothetical protein
MSALLALLTPIALINSIATLPAGIAGIVAALSAPKPYLTASAFIAGKFVPLFTFGLLLAVGLDAAFDQIGIWARDIWHDPHTSVVVLQLIIGGVMVVFAYRLSRASQHRPDRETTARMTPVGAFSVAAGATIVALPAALFYFAAIDQILRADLTAPGIVRAVLYYNVIYLSPLVLIVVTRRLFGSRADPLFQALAGFFGRWGKRLMLFGLLGLGAVLVADAIGWFVDFPLLPSYLR